MEITLVVELIVGILAMLTAFIGALAAGMRLVSNKIESIMKEFKPNGGSSMKDQINRLDKRIDDIYKALYEKEK